MGFGKLVNRSQQNSQEYAGSAREGRLMSVRASLQNVVSPNPRSRTRCKPDSNNQCAVLDEPDSLFGQQQVGS